MSTLQRRRWKVGVIVFACASPLILSLVWGLVGRPLSLFELLGMVGGLAAVVGAFTWALIPDQREETIPGKGGEFDVTTVLAQLAALPKFEKQHLASADKPPPLVAKSRARLAELPRPVGDTSLPTVRRSTDGAGKTVQVEKLQNLVSSDQDVSASSLIATPKPTIQSARDGLTRPPVSSVQIEFGESTKNSLPAEAIDQNRRLPQQGATFAETVPKFRWYGRGETVRVGADLLTDPMVYVSEVQPREEEASCIDLSLDVGRPVRESAGSLGYYPTYARISPNQRANYIGWLSNNRISPLNDIGYAFLFFYGLERRLLIDRQDLSPIVKEVVRLLETYTFSGSFDGYLSRFLAFVLARGGIETLKDKWFDSVFDKSRLQRDEDFLAVALAWFFKKNAPLPISWAMRIARQDPRCPRSVILDRLPEQFKSLFEKRYHENFGEGLILKTSKRDRPLSYRSASPSLLFHTELVLRSTEPIKIPNVLGIQSQFSSLAAIWTSCIEELRPLSRVMAKGVEAGTREAFEALPEDLKAKVEHPDKEQWDRVVADHTNEDGCALVEVSKLATIHGLEERTKLTPKQSHALAQTAEYVGLLIEPDPRLTNRPYSWKDVVSLLRPEEKPGLPPTDSRYLAASLMLELGIYIAAADGSIEDVEVDQIAHFLESQFLLDPPDSRRLEALKRVFVARPPLITGLGKRLEANLTREQREAVGRFLIGIAAANGNIDRKELTALRSAYRALGIEVDHLNKLLEEFRRASQEPIEVQRADETSERGEAIPPKPKAQETGGFTFDQSLLRRLMDETKIVAEILGKAMLDGDVSPADEVGSPQPISIVPLKDPRFGTLDIRFHHVLSKLLTRPCWGRAEFDSLARDLKLMPNGALDAINEWSSDAFDDPIIVDQGDELEIQSHLFESQQ
jgi:uncharacterized tellurite resistance protein B-like protein